MIQEKSNLYLPLKIALIYFVITLVLYFFGPIDFERTNNVFLLLTLITYQCAFSVGYWFYCKIINTENISYLDIPDEWRFASVKLFICIILTMSSLYAYTNVNFFNFNNLLGSLTLAIVNPLESYQNSFDNKISAGRLDVLFVTLLYPLFYYFLCRGIYEFKRLTPLAKFLLILALVIEAFRWIIQGRNKGVFDLLILIGSTVFVIIYQVTNQKTKKSKFKKITTYIFLMSLLIAALMYFSNAIESRKQYFADYSKYENTPLMIVLPKQLYPFTVNITDYLVQGYRAFSMVPNVEFDSLWGVGHSSFLMNNFSGLFDENLFLKTYQAKLEIYGIHPYVNWHTAYIWFANDVHWFGVIFVMFLLGVFFAKCWIQCFIFRNPSYLPLLGFMFITVFYFPSNAQVFIQPNTFIAFWVLFIVALFRKNRM